MDAYNFIFVWLLAFALFANDSKVLVRENILGKDERRWNLWLAFLIFLPIFLLASMGTPRSDTVLYITTFQNLPSTWEGMLSKIAEEKSGQGFTVFSWLVKQIFDNNVTVYRLLLAAVHSIPLILVFRKYSENYLLSVYLFVASACHIGWMMNGLRQFAAVTIIFAATPLLIHKKYISLIVIILLASTVHVSALIMLPVVFIAQGKAWNKKTIFYIIVALIAMYMFDTYTGLMDFLLEGTEYEGVVGQWQALGDDGTNPIRVLVNAVPMLLAFLGRRHVQQENDLVLNTCVNMSVITTGLYLISMVTSGIMIGRLPIYTSLYNFILLPNLIPKMFTKESVKIINLLMIGFYLIYYLFELIM